MHIYIHIIIFFTLWETTWVINLSLYEIKQKEQVLKFKTINGIFKGSSKKKEKKMPSIVAL